MLFFHFVLLKKQCNLFTDCIAVWVLAFFLKFRPAFGAGYDDFAFAPGDTDLLATAGTLVDMVGFPVGQVSFPVIYFVFYFFLPGQEFLIFRVTAVIIPGKHPVIAVNKQSHYQIGDRIAVDKQVQNNQNQADGSQKPGQLVGAVASLHKMLKFFSHKSSF